MLTDKNRLADQLKQVEEESKDEKEKEGVKEGGEETKQA